MPGTDRSRTPVRKIRLEDEGRENPYAAMTPSERVALVWTLTMQAWMFKEGRLDEPRLRRDAVRTLRRRG